jgi:hypothetical protein
VFVKVESFLCNIFSLIKSFVVSPILSELVANPCDARKATETEI